MIKEYEYLHGVVFSRLCSTPDINMAIRPYQADGYSAYVVNNRAGLYIKYSGKRLTPWIFTFSRSHQAQILEMHRQFGEVFIALVCHLDGVVVLDYQELKLILNEVYDEHEWLSVSRKRNQMYRVSASDGALNFKVGMASCPDKIVAFLR